MSEGPPEDPFRTEDPRAAEREARRREREERRKARSSGARRSLGERVSGALGAVTGAGHSGADRREPEPATTPPASPPITGSEPGATASEQPAADTGDWLADSGAGNPDTSEWLTETGEGPAVAAETGVTGEHGPITGESGAITGERASITGERGPVTDEHGLITGDHPPVTGESGAISPVADGGGAAGDRSGRPVGGGGHSRDPRALWIRRLIALGVFLVALGAIVLAAKAVLDGSDEPAPVAKGPRTLKTEDVVVPEGLTIAQMADVARKAGLKGNYEKAVDKAAKKFPLKKYDAADAESMEGFLFPATYNIEKNGSVDDLVADQLDAFQQYFDPIDLEYAEKKNLTPYDVLKIASMIEKEVQIDSERKKVAAVIYNRLAAGDSLGIDATLRYGLEKYSGQLLESELQSDDPYNTRVIAGLPPTPISNPGVASMKAAAKPAKTDDYYFVVKPGTCGKHFFTDSSEEFDQAAAKYHAALQAEGGSPTDC